MLAAMVEAAGERGGSASERPRSRITASDVGVAAVVGVAFALSPHTSAERVVPSIVGGCLAAAVALLLRARASRRRSDAPARPASSVVARPPLAFWLVFAAFLALWIPTLPWLFDQWTRSIWYDGHGLFVLPIALFLGNRVLRRDPLPDEESSAWGFPVLLAGLGLVVADAAIRTHYLSVLGLVLCLPGLSLLALGTRRTRALAAPLLLCFLLVPLPNDLAPALGLTQAVVAGMGMLIGEVDATAWSHETAFVTSDGAIAISANCSGFSAFHAGLGAALFLAAYTRSPLRRAALLLLVWPLTVLANVLRTSALLLLDQHFGRWIFDSPLHGLSGIAAFWMVLGPLLLLADRRVLRESFG